MIDVILDIVVCVLLLLGAYFSLAAAIGVIRFPDTLTRVHAGTKPQVFGLACILAAVILSTRNWTAIALVVLILLFQMLTTPTAAHMVGRATYRARQPGEELLYVDELEQAVELAHQEEQAEREAQAQQPVPTPPGQADDGEEPVGDDDHEPPGAGAGSL